MFKKALLMMCASLIFQAGHAKPLEPSEKWPYKVRLKQDLREVYSKGLCKIDDSYHLFMTAGITYKSKNRKDWEMYHAIPFELLEGKKLHGGPAPDCGEQPYFSSTLWGLYYYKNDRWENIAGPLPELDYSLDLVTGDRQRMYYSRSMKESDNYAVSSVGGWAKPEVLKNRKKYFYSYYNESLGFIGFHRSAETYDKLPPVRIWDNTVEDIAGVKPGLYSAMMLSGHLFMVRREGRNGAPLKFTAYAIDEKFQGKEIDFSPLNLTEAGPYECYNAQSDLAICRYNDGLVFVAETPTGLGAVTLPLYEGKGMSRKVFYDCTPGVDTLYCDDSRGEYLYGGLPYWVGTVSEFRYSDIVKRIQDDYHQYNASKTSD